MSNVNEPLPLKFSDFTEQHVLEFDGINRKDAGTYNVTASNRYGEEQVPCTLMVTENPAEAEDWAAQLKKT